jgi:hypothetical protein
MKFFESLRSSPKENEAESEIGGDKAISNLENGLRSKISGFKEQHPSLTKVIREGGKYITLFSALAVLNVPEAIAGDNNSGKTIPFEENPIVRQIDTLSLDSINKNFDQYRFKPADFHAEASMHLEERDKDKPIRSLDTASVADTEGEIGDFDVVSSVRLLQREAKEDGTDGSKNSSEKIFSEDVEIARVPDEEISERAPALKNMSATELGRSKKEAILAAIGALARQKETWIRDAVSINLKSSQKGEKRESSSRTTVVTAADSFVYLHNIKVISLTEVDADGDVYWEALVEAQG